VISRVVEDAAAFISDPGVWWSWVILTALTLLAAGVGAVIGRRVGLIREDASPSEALGLALGIGLLACAVTYATVRSGGTTVYLPAFVGLLAAIAFGRGQVRSEGGLGRYAAPLAAVLLSAVAVSILYGITIAPSARNGMQPVEFMDEAFYAALGAEIRASGSETIQALAGLGEIPGLPPRSWYHWGELWLAAAVLEVPGMTPMHARHAVVLPLLVVATAAIIGAIAARQVGRVGHRAAFLLAAFGMLSLAPVPLVRELHFDWWARGIGFSITPYGLAYVVIALGVAVLLRPRLLSTCLGAILGGTLVAAAIASHLLIAAASAVGVAVLLVARLLRADGDLPERLRPLVRPTAVAALAALATLAWGLATGHALVGDGAVQGVAPFDRSWLRSILLTAVGAGVLALGPLIAAQRGLLTRHLTIVGAGAGIATAVAGVAWGARLPDHNMFHVFFGAIAVIATPVAVILTVVAAGCARQRGMPRTALALATLLLTQGAIGVGATVSRLYEFGPGNFAPVPTAALAFVRSLPVDARLAYACRGFEEVAVWDARLVSITAHTGRTVIPMCFQSDLYGHLHGLEPDPAVMNPFFERAPQRTLYPSLEARPSESEITAFLDRYGIDYIWNSPDHPNVLLPDAQVLFSAGDVSIHRVP
jgi:hypothetical protein